MLEYIYYFLAFVFGGVAISGLKIKIPFPIKWFLSLGIGLGIIYLNNLLFGFNGLGLTLESQMENIKSLAFNLTLLSLFFYFIFYFLSKSIVKDKIDLLEKKLEYIEKEIFGEINLDDLINKIKEKYKIKKAWRKKDKYYVKTKRKTLVFDKYGVLLGEDKEIHKIFIYLLIIILLIFGYFGYNQITVQESCKINEIMGKINSPPKINLTTNEIKSLFGKNYYSLPLGSYKNYTVFVFSESNNPNSPTFILKAFVCLFENKDLVCCQSMSSIP